MQAKPTVIYVGTRRGPHEANRALMAARNAGYRVALLGMSTILVFFATGFVLMLTVRGDDASPRQRA